MKKISLSFTRFKQIDSVCAEMEKFLSGVLNAPFLIHRQHFLYRYYYDAGATPFKSILTNIVLNIMLDAAQTQKKLGQAETIKVVELNPGFDITIDGAEFPEPIRKLFSNVDNHETKS